MFNKNKKASEISSFILFVGLILISAIAAGILIQTSITLPSNALVTGSTPSPVDSSKPIISSIWAENSDLDSSISSLFITLKMAPGSKALDINAIVLELHLDNTAESFTRNGLIDTSIFTSNYLVKSKRYSDGYLSSGDIVQLKLDTPRLMISGDDLTIFIKVSNMTLTKVSSITPTIADISKVSLFP